MSLVMFYTYRGFQGPTKLNNIRRGGHLFHQYLVGQYCKIESKRLQYIRKNQTELRAARYA